MNERVIRVENVSKIYRIWDEPGARFTSLLLEGASHLFPGNSRVARWLLERSKRHFRDFYALREVSMELRRGESIGIIGRNGSGKSTLLQIVAGTLRPTSGEVEITGRVAALLELGSGFNPEFTGRENVYLNATVLGLKRKEIDERFESITAFADIGEFLDEPVKTYSSGMFVRLAFAVITHVSADILLIDEALTVGDIFFQQKCYGHLARLKEDGVAIVLVTHGMNDVEQFCSRAYLLHQGALRATGPSAEVVKRYYLINQAPLPTLPTASKPDTVAGAEQVNSPKEDWPTPAAFFDLSGIPQVTDGTARCLQIGLCNLRGEPSTVFQQGEEAEFFYEYELLRGIDQPIVGVVLFNNKQVIVHGKNSLEYGSEFGAGYPAGTKLRFKHRVKLEIAVGLYTFESGFASISRTDAANASQLNHFDLTDRVYRHCHLNGLGPFEVIFRHSGYPTQLLHHGVANLPGKIDLLKASA
jgi:lipopolysaccharide transport system ATP-binding protein